jgi:hypothetical protein
LATLFSPLKKLFFTQILRSEDDVETFSHQAYSNNAMRIVRLLAVFALAGGTGALRADPPAADNPAAYDPDTTPRAYTDKARPEMHESSRSTDTTPAPAQKKNDWLLRSYEEQLQARALADGQPQSNNLYSEITSNPDLAKAAGMAPATPAPAPSAVDLRAGNGSATLSLRSDGLTSAPVKNDAVQSAGSTFNPVLAPLDPSEANALHSLFSSLSSLSVNPNAGLDPGFSDPGALDVPGMTAAESDPEKRAELDLSLDHAPGEGTGAAKPQASLALALPADDAGRAQKEQEQATGQRKTISPAPINPLLLKDTESDTAHMVPDPTPIRGRVDDPYDILR